MLLHYVYLYLNTREYPDSLQLPFGFQTRYVGNFIERKISKPRFRTEGFGRICIEGREHPSEGCPIVGDKAALAEIYFDRAQYEQLADDEYSEFFLEMYDRGLRKCAKYYPLPNEALQAAMQEFREGGYKNEWLHKRWYFKTLGIKAALHCKMTIDEFVLNLEITRKKEVLMDKPILRTKPDELIFKYQFKDVVLEDDQLVVVSRLGETTYAMPVAEIERL